MLIHTSLQHKGPRATAQCTVWDANSGQALLVCDGTYATALRTAAAAGLAAKLMARPASRVAVLIGAGYQARTQLDALTAVFPLESVFICDHSSEKALELAQWGSQRWGIEVCAAKSSAEVIRRADIIVTATASSSPVFDGHDLQPGTHVNSIGSYRPDMHELDEVSLLRGKIVVDAIDHTPAESGDLIQALSHGATILGDLSWLVRNPRAARQSDSDITVYKSAGFALLDGLLLEALYEICMRQ